MACSKATTAWCLCTFTPTANPIYNISHSRGQGCRQLPLVASELAEHAGRLFLVDRGGQTQASITVGEVGIDLLDPDSFALDVLGDIMNGFGGRLFDELRSKEVRALPVLCLTSSRGQVGYSPCQRHTSRCRCKA